MTSEKIKTRIVLEMLGRPKEHLVETMGKLIEALGKEKGIAILEKTVHEPRKMEDKDENGKVIEIAEDQQLYTTFSEIDIEADEIIALLGIVFRYMPSHIEIISPEELALDNFNLNTIINELVTRLHHYDAVAKSALVNNQMLAKKMQHIITKTGYTEDKIENAEKKEAKEEVKEKPKKSKKEKK